MNQQQINLKEKSLTELKALAYDVQGFVTQYTGILGVIKQEIENRIAEQNRDLVEPESEPDLEKV